MLQDASDASLTGWLGAWSRTCSGQAPRIQSTITVTGELASAWGAVVSSLSCQSRQCGCARDIKWILILSHHYTRIPGGPDFETPFLTTNLPFRSFHLPIPYLRSHCLAAIWSGVQSSSPLIAPRNSTQGVTIVEVLECLENVY